MRRRVEEPPYEKWYTIAAAMGCHERTARRWAQHSDPSKRLKVAFDPFGRVYCRREWLRDWAQRNTRTNAA